MTGRNGAGKSSLLRMIAGLLRIEGGALSLAGGDKDRSIGEQAHYLGHQDALKPSLSVIENLDFWSAWLGGSWRRRARALGAVGLDTHRGIAGLLSFGGAEAAAVACAARRHPAPDLAARRAVLRARRGRADGAARSDARASRQGRDDRRRDACADIAIDGMRELRIGPA